ncbi:hypothetical protein vBRpoSV10_27 [Ruegeria phage vB_RpoS-V10]|nr:hypothetical protein vBRpoSV10_27 [Ruegeria phage vB_RpoS-V10]
MPSLSDLKTQSLLEAILDELREIRKIVAEPTEPGYPDPYLPPPYIPTSPANPPREWPARNCSRCGIQLSGVMGYACQHADCPTGLGPTIC